MSATRKPPETRWQRCHALVALRPRRRPQREGQGAARPRHRRLRRSSTASSRCGWSCSPSTATATAPAAASARTRVATARPDILDRNGEILATDVKTPSLFAEPRKLIDVDEAEELLTAVMPDLDTKETRERLSSKKRLRLAQARDHAAAAARDPPARHSRHRLPHREQARLSERAGGQPRDRPRQYRQPGHRRHREMAGRAGARRAAHGGARHRPAAAAGAARARSARAVRAARRTGQGAREVQGQGFVRRHPQRQYRRDRRAGVGARLRSQQSARGQRSDPHQPAHHRRLRDGLDLQGAHGGDGARFRQGDAHPRCSTRSHPLHYGRFAIHDYEPKHRALSVPEIFTYSSNIGAARMALARRRRRAPGVPEKDGPARPAAHRIAGKRRADRAQALGRAQHRDHRLRPRPVGRAVAGGDGHRRDAQRRPAHPADLPQAQRGRGDSARQAGAQARDQPRNALSDAAQRREGHRHQGQRRRLLCRRQDRHGGKGRQRPLFEDTSC